MLAAVVTLSAPVFAATEGSTQRMKNVDIEADEILFVGRGIIHMRGSTQFVQGNRRVYADQLIFNNRDQTVEFRGSVRVETSSGDVVRTPVLHYDFIQNSAVSGVAEFVLTNRRSDDSDEGVLFDGACGSARLIQFEGGTISHMEGAKIATCGG